MKTPHEIQNLKIEKTFLVNLCNLENQIENWNLISPIYYSSRVSSKDEILLRALDKVVTKLKLKSWNVEVITDKIRDEFYEIKLKITPRTPLNFNEPYTNFQLEVASQSPT